MGVNGATATSPTVASSGAGGAGANFGGAGGAGIGTSGTTSVGNPGAQPGGGGGGSRTSQDAGNQSGGVGGAGRIIITWTCPANAGTLTGNQYICTYGTMATTLSSTVLGGTWSSGSPLVATVNSATGVVTSVAAGTAIITYTIASSGCTTSTATRTVYVTNAPSGAPNFSGTPSTSQCQGSMATYTINPVIGASSYIWSTSYTGWTIAPSADGLSATITFGPTAVSGNFAVKATNGCDPTGAGATPLTSSWVTISNIAAPTSVTPSMSTSICNSASLNLNATSDGNTINWYTTATGGILLGNSASGTNFSVSPSSNTTYYAETKTASGCISATRTATALITVYTSPSAPTIGTTTQPTCSTATGSVVLGGLPSGSWVLTRSPGSITTSGTEASTTISGLAAGTTYTYSVNNFINGLKGEYFNNIMTLSGSPTLTRTDATVNFDWANGSPDPSIGNDNFSVRWSGFVQPLYSETYTFTTRSDDGIRLWINGTQLINNWNDHSAVNNTGTISLTAGVKYDIVLEYYENSGLAVSQLSWSSPSQVSQIIPSTQLFSVSSCGSPASANVVINTQPATPSVPTVGVTTHPDCVNGGSVVLSGLPASGTINQTGTTTNSYSITGTTMTISGLAVGSYNFTASNGSCTSSATGNVVVNAAVTNTWTTVWSNGTPNSSQALIFNGNYPLTPDPNVDITGCSCTVNTGRNVIVKTGRNLIITNEVVVSGTGTLTFENTSSLVQTNNASINSGNIIYQRTSTSALTSDYTYWSSPVVNHNLSISPSYASGMYYSYNDFSVPEDWKKESASTAMFVGKGYIIRGPQISSSPPPPPGLYYATFTGVPNNGIKTIAIGPTTTSNLLGNPYPSAINANTFLSTNSALIEGTIYFWTHNTAIQLASNIDNRTAGSGVLAYTSDDYASYNGTGGVAVSEGIIPTGKIAAGQAFFTTSKATGGSVTFNNIMRLAGTTIVDKTGINQQFFKTKNTTKITNAVEKNRLWLNLSNKQGAFKQTLVGYLTDATNDYDSSFDGESFDGNEFVDFYSISLDKNLVIQGRALPFDENDEVPLGFRSTIDGSFTINIDQVDGLLANQPVFVEDKLTNTVFDLKGGNYTFNTLAGTFNDRFVLRYTNKTLSASDLVNQSNQVLISIKNKKIKINSLSETIDKVIFYDVLGRQIYQNGSINSNEFLITNLISSHQTLIVKTTLQNGKTVVNKIIY
ncbi:T9SS sorting signal type C domain-containing protein [Flavobacterium franklandianum]|nr:T9SS sorting signal type C domain-containing protein [Flavobacterium franklandianum]